MERAESVDHLPDALGGPEVNDLLQRVERNRQLAPSSDHAARKSERASSDASWRYDICAVSR